MEPLKLYVISHTHWDREWYQTFQHYRYRLVRALDHMIEQMEKDPEYRLFHLDGQTIVLEDYLEIRPEMADRLAALIRAGRLVIGPWYVMPDEFLISGEALIKNLQLGHRISRSYGVEPMKNGYVTDIFGHNSQFPQLLQGFDIPSATLYRGIADYEKDAFLWQSPDGSRVTAAKLEAERSYSNFYFAVRWPYEEGEFDPEDAVKRMQALVDRARKMAATDVVLMMDGVDHSGMEPNLYPMMRLFEEKIPGITFHHAHLEEYFDAIRDKALEVIEGSLYHVGRKGNNNQVLKNVLSSMVHIKQQNDRCEMLLTRGAEPLNALSEMLGAQLKAFRRDDYSLSPRRAYLDRAWKYLLQNHPHDSICGCSLSDVHRDNEYRYRQAGQMGEIAIRDCVQLIARNIHCEGKHQEAVLLLNPGQRAAKGVQLFTMLLRHQQLPNRRFYDAAGNPLTVQVLKSHLTTQPQSRTLQLVRFPIFDEVTVAAEVEIPAFGYTVIYCDNLRNHYPDIKPYGADEFYPPCRLQGSQMTGYGKMDNGALQVAINGAGLLDVTVKRTGRSFQNLHLLEDRSDGGEGWNWRPVPFDRTVYGHGCLQQFSVEADGPLCTVWRLTYALKLPQGMTGDMQRRGEREEQQEFTTYVTLLKDSETLHFHSEICNHVENHRLRVLFPTGLKTDHFYTKTPFDMVKWPVQAEDSHDATEMDTLVHPAQGISALWEGNQGAALYTRGLYEVEVTDNEQRALALTLFRAAQKETGTLDPEDIKMQRQMAFDYALDLGRSDAADALLAGEAWRAGLHGFAFEQNAQGALPAEKGLMAMEETEKVFSSLTFQDGKYYFRLYDVSGKEEEVTLTLPAAVRRACLVNLDHRQLSELQAAGNQVRIPCPPHKIVTVCLEMD